MSDDEQPDDGHADRHADDRDEKRRKARHGMRVSGGSIKRTLLPLYGSKKPKGEDDENTIGVTVRP